VVSEIDAPAVGWLLLGVLIALTLVMSVTLGALWKLFGAHGVWALSVAVRRAIDAKCGTAGLEVVKEEVHGSE
jgi:hypothetical protein